MGFVTSICIAVVVTALFKLLIPENKFSKQLSLLTACVFLLTGITAVSGVELDFEDSAEIGENVGYIRFSEQVDETLKDEICGRLEDELRALLAESEIFPEQINIIVNISGLYGIDITEVRVLLDNEADVETAQSLLEDALSGEIKLTVETR